MQIGALLAATAFLGCATLTGEHYVYCGAIQQVAVRVQDAYPGADCDSAIAITKAALWLVSTHGPAVSGPWEIDFTWANLDASHPVAQIEPEWRLIRVRRPRAVLHELFHAALFEDGKGTETHALMCSRGLDRVELEFDVGGIPYCGRAGL